ncbi:MAG TPA: hypothetical protein VNG51_17985 [Ktedonobacteraceae bacterium]|nr:hypothetical protein [Ktedonobacteraceae bacterium]
MTLPTLPFWLVLSVVLVTVYLLGLIPPIGRMWAFGCKTLGELLLPVENLLAIFKDKLTASESTYIGLHTSQCLIALFFAGVVLTADASGNFAALTSLYGPTVDVPSLPPIYNLAIGAVFLAAPALLGMCMLELKGVIPEEARLFTLLEEKSQGWFSRWVTFGLWLSIPDCVLYYVLKPLYLANSGGSLVALLQVIIFLLLGCLLAMVSILSLYIVAIGLSTFVALSLGLLWFCLSAIINVLDFLTQHYTDPERQEAKKHIQRIRPVVKVVEAAPAPAQALLAQPAPTTDILASSQAVLDKIISDVVSSPVKAPPFPGRTRERFPIYGDEKFKQIINTFLTEAKEKVPQFYEQCLEYLPKAEQDFSIRSEGAIGRADGLFAYDDATPYHVARHVLWHEVGHCVWMHHHDDSSEDAANDYAAMVVAKIESYEVTHDNA